MLMARNADMCSKCLVTEPVVKSFINQLRIKPAVTRFRQASLCKMTMTNQMTNANRPPGSVTSINQPKTPRV